MSAQRDQPSTLEKLHQISVSAVRQYSCAGWGQILSIG